MRPSGYLAAVLIPGAILASAAPAAAKAPDTSIKSGPSGLIASQSAGFRFKATVRRATFQCKLDAKRWKTCKSEKRYEGLDQGLHTFRVRARKAGAVDSSPAVRAFTVDSIAPESTILSGPTGVSGDHAPPSFTFSSTEPGSFECQLETTAFESCASPFTGSSPLPDNAYTFQVRATDAAGNTETTPASQAFGVETPLSENLETAQTAAQLYFPDAVNLDVPASCGGSPAVDCPGGTPMPPADQLSVASTRSVVEVVNAHRYDVTVTSAVATLSPIIVTVPAAGECHASVNSAPGATPTWTVTAPLNFLSDPSRILVGSLNVSGVEADDVSLSGGVGCAFANLGLGFYIDLYRDTVQAYLSQVGNPMCAAPGPAYLGPCPPP